MHELAKELIERRIETIAEEWSARRRREKGDDCLCLNGKPCHKLDDLNCFFCLCPEYDISKEEGGCRINNQNGRYIANLNNSSGKIWDCSYCSYPHQKEVVKSYLRKMFFGEEKEKKEL